LEDIAPYDRRVEAAPHDGAAYLSRGKCHMRNGDYALGKADFEKALEHELDPDVPPDERGIRYERPGASDARLQLGAALVELGQLEAAAEQLELGLELDPSEQAYTARGAVKLLRGDLGGALSDLDVALGKNPRSERALKHRASCYEKLNQPAAAEADLAAILSRDPRSEPARTRWIELRRRAGKPHDPLVDIPAPRAALERYQRASLLAQRGAHQDAAADLSTLLVEHPDFAHAWLGRGLAREQLNDIPGALSDFQQFAQLLPGDVQGPLQQGRLLLGAGRFEPARALLEQALALAPQDVSVRYHLGVVLLRQGDARAALEHFAVALPLAVSWYSGFRPLLLEERAKAHAALGNPEAAAADSSN
jgi:tetratricopeptide (TPR) repeat protein